MEIAFITIGALVAIGLVMVYTLLPNEEPEPLEEPDTVAVQRSSLIFPLKKAPEESDVRLERLEAAVLLIEQAFGWVLIPRDGQEPEVNVLQKEESGHIVVLPAIHVKEMIKPAATKPILPRMAGSKRTPIV